MRIFVFLLCIATLSACSQSVSSAEDINIGELGKLIGENKNIQLVDVRTKSEFNQGHINNAMNIDFLKDNFLKQSLSSLDTTKAVYLYCRTANRSKKAANLLKLSNFREVYYLKGGYTEWIKKE